MKGEAMKKPKEAAKWFNEVQLSGIGRELQLFLNSLPDEFEIVPAGLHVCEWPKELTRERLEELANCSLYERHAQALRALAAIAPERKKRMVNLWESQGFLQGFKDGYNPNGNDKSEPWRKVGGPFEIEE